MAWWSPEPPTPKGFPVASADALRGELARRMAGVQRHRLLQGFPMAPMMGPSRSGVVAPQKTDPRRPVILGVLPHTFCVPAIQGCGFCTFPHEANEASQMVPLALAIAREIASRDPLLRHRPVRAVYFGGGTANLTSIPALAVLVGALTGHRLHDAEVTLEGVPRFFSAEQLDLLAGLGTVHLRVSMGVQTFDEGWLQRMGRQHIGSPSQVEAAVALAGARGAATSIDLLINLPGQPVAAMLDDVRRAVALGVDQICVYHLVLRDGLPVPWASDPAMMAVLPSNEAAFDAWRAVRGALLEAGYTQSTLTNFERAGARPFVYEPMSFAPQWCDALGFGPGAITGVNFGGPERALKWTNRATAASYLGARLSRVERVYWYEPFEEALMQLTRGLALLRVPLGQGPLAAHARVFAPELAVLQEAGLVVVDAAAVTLTQRGMFYADSVAGLLAWRSVTHRGAVGLNEPAELHMG